MKYIKSIDLKALYIENSKKWVFEEGGIGICKSMLYKRYPFHHEKEIRLIYNTFLNTDTSILKYDIKPIDLIDNIVFDPRLNLSDFKNKKSLLKEVGYDKLIIRSNLYKLPIYNIIK